MALYLGSSGKRNVNLDGIEYSLRFAVKTVPDEAPVIFTTNGYGEIIGLTDYGMTLSNIEIPSEINGETISRIGSSSFKNNTNLGSVVIPDSVLYIDSNAFSGCSNMNNVVIGNGVTYIDGSAFARCTSLTNVIIPDSCYTMKGSIFYGCTGLTGVTIGTHVTSIGSYSFEDCSNLTSIIFKDPDTWYHGLNVVSSGGTRLDVSDPSYAAKAFTSLYTGHAWYKT